MIYPKISIVTPNYNGDKYLEETILSVLNQNYPNLEYIIIDGGSTDNSVEIIKKYQKNLTYWISEKDDGLYSALQKGFDKSTGEIMGWINSDDKFHARSFFTLAELFNVFPGINWLTGCTTHFDEKGRTVKVADSYKFTKYDFYTGEFKWIQQESTFWRRSLWEKVEGQFNLKLKLAGDFDLWLRFFRYEKLYATNALIGGFRLRSAHQLSLLFYDDYLKECKACLEAEKISEEDEKIVSKYERAVLVTRFLNRLKIFPNNWYVNRIKRKYFIKTPSIVFNRHTQKFEM